MRAHFASSPTTDHLELVFLASTLTPAVRTGWRLSATPAPLMRPRTPLPASLTLSPSMSANS